MNTLDDALVNNERRVVEGILKGVLWIRLVFGLLFIYLNVAKLFGADDLFSVMSYWQAVVYVFLLVSVDGLLFLLSIFYRKFGNSFQVFSTIALLLWFFYALYTIAIYTPLGDLQFVEKLIFSEYTSEAIGILISVYFVLYFSAFIVSKQTGTVLKVLSSILILGVLCGQILPRIDYFANITFMAADREVALVGWALNMETSIVGFIFSIFFLVRVSTLSRSRSYSTTVSTNGIVTENQVGFFKGRLGSTGYFLRLFFMFMLSIVMNVTSIIAAEDGDQVIPILILIVSIPLTVYIISCHVRRCHDLDKSGSFVLFLFIPLVNLFILLYLLFTHGTEGPNRYGPDPRAPLANPSDSGDEDGFKDMTVPEQV